MSAAPKQRPDSGPQLRPREIYRRHFSYVWHTLRRLGCPAADLEDHCHDVFVVVYRRIDDYDPDRPLRPWLFGIAYRVLSQKRRRRERRREVPLENLDPIDERGGTAADIDRARARALVAAALDRLALSERAVFVLHEIDGCTAPEIAAALAVPTNTVYSRLRRSRRKFAAAARRLRGKGVTP